MRTPHMSSNQWNQAPTNHGAVQGQPAMGYPGAMPQQKKSNTGLWVGFGCGCLLLLALLIGVIVLAVMLMGGDDSKESKDGGTTTSAAAPAPNPAPARPQRRRQHGIKSRSGSQRWWQRPRACSHARTALWRQQFK